MVVSRVLIWLGADEDSPFALLCPHMENRVSKLSHFLMMKHVPLMIVFFKFFL